MNLERRKQFNERFLQRLLARRPQDRPEIERRLQQETRHPLPESPLDPRDLALETIVNRERPVLFVRDGHFDLTEVTALGPEAVDLIDRMKQQGSRLSSVLPLIGRIDVVNFPNVDYLGTGWFVDSDVIVTNRHVASLVARWDGRKFAFTRGVGGRPIESSFCNAHEFDDLAPDATRMFRVTDVLFIERDNGPDVAFLRVDRRTDGRGPSFIPVAATDAGEEVPVCVIGYPARASKNVIPDQDLMKRLYRDRFDVKRAAPGFTSGREGASTTHDCTTLGGNSGSVVLELTTGKAVGLHYAGVYEENNFAVPASALKDYITRKRWNSPPNIETGRSMTATVPLPASATAVPADSGNSVSVTIPITVTVTVGTPQQSGAPARTVAAQAVVDVARVEEVLPEFWDRRPDGVLAARVGYFDDGDAIGDVPCIAASVRPSQTASFEVTGSAMYNGVPVRYVPATVEEQVQALPTYESVDSIAYDDDARAGEGFSFAQVNEPMEATLHVGPEYSWEVLEDFLKNSRGSLVSAMYEFHAAHIKNAIEARLKAGGSLTLVMDNATFGKVHSTADSFDRVAVFKDWAEKFPFVRIVVPEGTQGLISDSYHIKVTVRDDDTFWLSSGNWKAGSSQPIITTAQRNSAVDEDLPGNREWHVVITNKTLASRFRNHIMQDLRRSETLGGDVVPPPLIDETFVDIPIDEGVLLERRAPERILKPKTINRTMKVRPLLTPDGEGAVFSEAVLDLIESARTSLLFQIPYIGMPANPRQSRGFIDKLIRALTAKLKSMDDARVLLRAGGRKLSAPTHAAWFFKSKGVDIKNRLRVIDDHHTKGMIVDGRHVLIGSHNWSKPGVTLNRDASLLFDDEEVAEYFTEAFEIDWNRANPVRPKRFRREAVVLEAVGDAPPPGFERVPLSELLQEDD
jgi:phosphatidylserine/phosphatidylglycerophosphate/cardiolipin synthase-like enzyme